MTAYQDVFKRYEKKYLVTQRQYNQLARALAPHMVPDRFAQSTIGNIYYDTPDFRLIRRSLDRPPYKEKLRLRAYCTPEAGSEAFVEIKKKYDHIVYKRRIAMPYGQALAYLGGGRSTGSAASMRGCGRRYVFSMTASRCRIGTSRSCASRSILASGGGRRTLTWRPARPAVRCSTPAPA